MRVTESFIVRNLLYTVNQSRQRINQLHTQIATGKRISKVSDDPHAADTIMRLNSAISRNEQFQRNIADGRAMMEVTLERLDSFAGILVEVKETITRASNGTQTETLGTFAERIDQLLDEALTIANTRFNGKYLFGGKQTLEPPFIMEADRSAISVNPNGITGLIAYPVGEGLTQVVNIDGEEAFLGTQVFDGLILVRDELRGGQFPVAGRIETISSMLDHVLGKASKAGSILQSLDALESHLIEQQTQLLGLLSVQQDTDVAESIMRLRHEELMLDSALNVGARIVPKSLLDFLK